MIFMNVLVLILVFLTGVGTVEGKETQMSNPVDMGLIKYTVSGSMIEFWSEEPMAFSETQDGYAAIALIGENKPIHEKYNTTAFCGSAKVDIFVYETSDGGEVMHLYFDQRAQIEMLAQNQMYQILF